MNARDLLGAGDLHGAAEAEAKACDRNGYDWTAALIRLLSTELLDVRAALAESRRSIDEAVAEQCRREIDRMLSLLAETEPQ